MTNRASQVILLCEDHLMEVFLRRFLSKGWGIKQRAIRVMSYPRGQGSGEQFVRKQYPNQLKAFRKRQQRASTILVVALDADTDTVEQHHLELAKACVHANIEPRQDGESVIHLVPKHHIETWLAYLAKLSVNEEQEYKNRYGFRKRESDIHPLVDGLAHSCKNNLHLVSAPPSLLRTCKEFERIRGKLP